MKYELNLVIQSVSEKDLVEAADQAWQAIDMNGGMIVKNDIAPIFDVHSEVEMNELADMLEKLADCDLKERCKECSLRNVNNCKGYLAKAAALLAREQAARARG